MTLLRVKVTVSQGHLSPKEREKAFASVKSIGNVVYFHQSQKEIFEEKNKASSFFANLMITREEYKEDVIKTFNPLLIDTSDIFGRDLDVDSDRIEKDIEDIIHYYKK